MKSLFIIIFLFIVLTGCAESSFVLSEESRIPKWFEVPEGKERKDIKVTMHYYVMPWGRSATFKMKTDGSFFSKKIKGKSRGLYPNEIEGSTYSYEVITAKGLTDVIEHRKMEPVFYTTDDPDIWKALNVEQ